jgi:hypothetical protein
MSSCPKVCKGNKEAKNDDALAVESNQWKGKGKDGKGKDGKRKGKVGPCWSCGGPHMKKECPQQKEKGEEKNGSHSNSGKLAFSANVVDDDNIAFLVGIEEVKDIPLLETSVRVEVVEMLEDFFGADVDELEGESGDCAGLSDSDEEDYITHV